MSNLQLGLLLLGALVIALLLVQSLYKVRRSAVRRAEAEPQPGAIPKQEPMLDAPPAPTPEAGSGTTAEPERVEPVLAGAHPPPRRAGPRLDALIDAIATIAVEAPVAGETAAPHLPASRRAGTKPLLVEGLDTETGDWEPPMPGRRYSEFQAGVQLANRGGFLNEIEYSEFVQKVQAFAEPLAALPDFPDMLDAVARARELDAFASEYDAQLALRLVARGAAWSPGYVQQHAARHGFVAGALPGKLVRAAAEEGAPPVLTLAFDAQAALAEDPAQSAVRELTLAFDVPQTAREDKPFDAWCSAGQALAADLDAALFDDGGQPLRPESFAAIGAELDRLYDALAARDLAAGSAAARRLFS